MLLLNETQRVGDDGDGGCDGDNGGIDHGKQVVMVMLIIIMAITTGQVQEVFKSDPICGEVVVKFSTKLNAFVLPLNGSL